MPSPRSISTLARQERLHIPRRHSFSLTSKTDRRSFVNRLLYKTSISLPSYVLYPLYGCVLSTVLLKRE